MPIVTFIPERYKQGFENITNLKPKEFTALKEGLSLMALVSNKDTLAAKLSDSKNLEYNVLSEIFDSVGSLIGVAEDDDKTNEIIEDLAEIAIDEKLIKPTDGNRFKERVLFLIQNQHLYYAAKTENLNSEFANLYLSAKIVSDIRPVFGINIDEPPKGAIVIHNLHIHYRAHREDAHKDIYLALDSTDIESMITNLKRAQQKEASLKHIFKKSDMTDLNE